VAADGSVVAAGSARTANAPSSGPIIGWHVPMIVGGVSGGTRTAL
jgi:hypothetical protein